MLSQPEGADVRINGTLRGQTPWSGQLPAESRAIELVKDGYESWSMTLTPDGDFSIRGTLTRSTSKDSSGRNEGVVASDPNSTVTRVMPVGSDSPETSAMVADPSRETPERSPEAPDESVEPDTGETASTVAPETIPFVLRSEPSGALVTIDGETVGHTPLERRELQPGTATIRLQRSGYHDWAETLSLDEPTRLTVNLRRVHSSLILSGTPDTMRVTVDGTTIRPGAGKRLEMKPGTYTVSARARDYESFDTTVRLAPGETRRLPISLDAIPHVWDYPATRDVFLRLGRRSLGELVETFGLEAGDRVRVLPARDDPPHALVQDVLSMVMNRKALIVVDDADARNTRSGDTIGTSTQPLDALFSVRVVDMDVDYEEAGEKNGEAWTRRYFTMKLFAKLIKPDGGEVQYSRYFQRTTQDTVPTRFRDALEKSYSSGDATR